MGSFPTLVLASASPQRRAILERLGVVFQLRPTHVAEIERGEPGEVAVQNALRKARAACASSPAAETAGPSGDASEIVLGCDTLVALDGRIYGKPADEREARATLRALSGATHTVLSGLALLSAAGERVALARTEVDFRELGEDSIDWYVTSGEWRGRAGGYAIQGIGAALVRAIRGDYENVVGLPLATLLDMCPNLLMEHARDRH
ncbi:MAG TPA: Maf family protein [Solirubrobacteraceae bacterium]|nr:Maf family protein [Solirubrobacteraceae bacterium]